MLMLAVFGALRNPTGRVAHSITQVAAGVSAGPVEVVRQ